MAQTLYDKLMGTHVVREQDGTTLIYIDRQLIHEVTSPQAFEGLTMSGRKPWRNKANLAVPDHNVPTTERSNGVSSISDPVSRLQVETLDKNCETFEINQIQMKKVKKKTTLTTYYTERQTPQNRSDIKCSGRERGSCSISFLI